MSAKKTARRKHKQARLARILAQLAQCAQRIACYHGYDPATGSPLDLSEWYALRLALQEARQALLKAGLWPYLSEPDEAAMASLRRDLRRLKKQRQSSRRRQDGLPLTGEKRLASCLPESLQDQLSGLHKGTVIRVWCPLTDTRQCWRYLGLEGGEPAFVFVDYAERLP